MAKHSANFESTAGGLVLTDAILLYRAPTGPRAQSGSQHEATAFASIHAVDLDDAGKPMIAAGTSLSRARLRQWAEVLERTVPPEILPENVLVAHTDMLAWWIPEQVRSAYFALSDPPADLRAIAGRTVVPVPYPAHLFVATRTRLGVYALPVSQRPSADTPVLRSPILNVFSSGHLCWGNIPMPKSLMVAAIPEYEAAVFNSWSTHPNPGQELTLSGKGGLVRLWDDLAARHAAHFPTKRLRPFAAGPRPGAASKTVGQVIAEGTQP